jgi:hypothetical protein
VNNTLQGITEDDFVKRPDFGNKIFPQTISQKSNKIYEIEHTGQYGEFVLNAKPETIPEEKIERSIISIREKWLSVPLKYRIVSAPIQEQNVNGLVHSTEGRYLVNAANIYILKNVALFGANNPAPALADNNNTGIHENDIRQGGIGDCYFLVCLMVLAKYEPGTIMSNLNVENIVNGKPTGFTATMYSQTGQPDEVQIPIIDFLTHGVSQANLSEDYDDNDCVEVWPQVYEKAWVKVRSDSGKFGNITGGFPNEAWTALTGRICPDTIGTANKTNAQILNDIATAINNGFYVCIGTKKTIPKSLVTQPEDGVPDENHAYMVVDCNATHVTLANPHGINKGVVLSIDDLNKVVNYIFPLPHP